jgi:hypothetical protein
VGELGPLCPHFVFTRQQTNRRHVRTSKFYLNQQSFLLDRRELQRRICRFHNIWKFAIPEYFLNYIPLLGRSKSLPMQAYIGDTTGINPGFEGFFKTRFFHTVLC